MHDLGRNYSPQTPYDVRTVPRPRDPRIRSLAEEMRKQDMAERALLRADFELEEATLDPYLLTARSGEQVKDLDCETGDADDPHWISQAPF